MIYERLRVFVSSTMNELAPERAAIKSALSDLNIEAWTFEDDAGAQPQSGQQAYKQEIDNADLYVGLFWREYGAYTIDEFDYAKERGKDRLIFEKRADVEGKRDPELEAFLKEASNVETGLAVRWFETIEELSAGVKDDAAKWQTRIIRKSRELNARYQPSPIDASEQRTLEILRRKVKRFWVDSVLQDINRRAELLELSKDTQPDAVGSPWEAVLELPFERARPVESGMEIADVFDDVEHSLLILGQPGAGKTTTLLTLARTLLERAGGDSSHPVPVVFHLSSWIDPQQPFEEWLISELNDKYEIPTGIGASYLEHQRLLLLLDGLDEVAREVRESCVEAVNRFAKEFGLPGIAMCCRLRQYEELDVKLALNGAICLRPLSDAQIDKYVEEAGPDLTGLQAAIRRDSDLRELARSPLILNLMCISYRGYEPDRLASPEERGNHLFSAYIDKMFGKRGASELAYSRERTLGWISWIATRLSERSQTMFQIEDLQPSYLSSRGQRLAYMILLSVGVGLFLGLASIVHKGAGTFDVVVDVQQFVFLERDEWILWLTVTPIWVLIYAWLETIGAGSGKPFLERPLAGIKRAAAKCLVSAVVWLLVAGAVATVLHMQLTLEIYWSGVAIPLVLGALGRNRSVCHSVRTVETFRWSLRDAWKGAFLGSIGGAAIGVPLFFGKLQNIIQDSSMWWVPILGFVVIGLGLGGMAGGLQPHVKDSKMTPNQGIRLSLRWSALMSLNAVWLVGIGVLIALAGGFDYTPNPSFEVFGIGIPMLGNFVGLFTVLILWFGGFDVVKHYALRVVLSISRQVPWNLGRFLVHARDLNLMQGAGNAYSFIHRRLRDYCAANGGLDSKS